MKSTGITRAIDQLGRVVLPKELRDTMELPVGTSMEFFTDGNTIVMRKYEQGCVFCGEVDNTVGFKGKVVCRSCRSSI